MNKNNADLLSQVQIASPCNVSWSSMQGSQRAKFCGKCRLHVFNLSAMTRTEAEQFVKEATGPTCVRLYKRADGTVLTSDCRGGIGAAYDKLRLWVLGCSAFGALAATGILSFFVSTRAIGGGLGAPPQPVGTVQLTVVVAARAIPAGTIVCLDDLRIERRALALNAITYSDISRLIGTKCAHDIEPGASITPYHIIEKH